LHILIVEDEKPLADGLADGLRTEGYTVDVVYSGTAALELVAAKEVDIVILDRDLPGIHGDMVCSVLRNEGHPAMVLMLTAAATVGDRVSGLDLGADAYLTKPFAYAELLAQLRSLARRMRGQASPLLELGSLRIDTARRIVERDGLPLRLTPKEYAILDALVAADGGWLTAEELLEEAWPDPSAVSRSVVRTTVYTLRLKLGHPDPIESATGYGYRLAVKR